MFPERTERGKFHKKNLRILQLLEESTLRIPLLFFCGIRTIDSNSREYWIPEVLIIALAEPAAGA